MLSRQPQAAIRAAFTLAAGLALCEGALGLVRGESGTHDFTLEVGFHAGPKHLPMVQLKQVASIVATAFG